MISAVGSVRAPAVPSAFVANTATRSRLPTSLDLTVYVCVLVPAMFSQLAPVGSQSCHLYANDVGEFDHVPWVTRSVCPGLGVPRIRVRRLTSGNCARDTVKA